MSDFQESQLDISLPNTAVYLGEDATGKQYTFLRVSKMPHKDYLTVMILVDDTPRLWRIRKPNQIDAWLEMFISSKQLNK